jgi:cysteine desulfurase
VSPVNLDHAATTPLRPEALAAMLPFLRDGVGNPSGSHSLARAATRALDEARESLSETLGVSPPDIVFTSGGTEADNLALAGAHRYLTEAGVAEPVVIGSAVEHPAVRETVKALGGCAVPVDRDGVVDLSALADLVERAGERLAAVSVMLVNNETGVVEPLTEVVSVVRRLAGSALVHCDAVQGFVWCDVRREAAGADMLSLSAHKFGGPQGVGALVAGEEARSRLRPLLHGGPQERELRAGTQNVAGAVGMAVAARLTEAEREAARRRVDALADRLLAGLVRSGDVEPAVQRHRRVGAICNVRFCGVVAEELLLALDAGGVYASAGSACASGALEPSPVLAAMGIERGAAREHVRFSLGYETTEDDVDRAVAVVAGAVGQLRKPAARPAL